MKQPEDALVIHGDRTDTTKDVAGEADAFVPSAPESLPHLTVPDLAPDASGISAKELARIPTLTEQISHPVAPVPVAEQGQPERPTHVQPQLEPELLQAPHPEPELASVDEVVPEPSPMAVLVDVVALSDSAQALPVSAESWLEQCHSRVNQLNDEIHQLNDRLDQLEHRPKA